MMHYSSSSPSLSLIPSVERQCFSVPYRLKLIDVGATPTKNVYEDQSLRTRDLESQETIANLLTTGADYDTCTVS